MKKLIDLAKKYPAYAVGAVALAVALITVLLVLLIGGIGETDSVWENGISEGILRFSDTAKQTKEGDGYVAEYYEEVTTEQVEAYIATLESELSVKFESEKYPRTAIHGEKIIVVNYNVTEMKLSVTVTLKGDNNISGENQE